MNNKRNLIEELNIGTGEDFTYNLDLDIEKIKGMVNNGIDTAYSERKLCFMKSRKNLCMVAIVATFILGITVFAASNIASIWYSGSSGIPEYAVLPTAERCIKDIGYEPVLINEFENGYKFKNGSVVNNRLADENDNSIEKFNSVTFRYEKEGDMLYYSQEKFDTEFEVSGDIIANIDGAEVYYSSYINKFVPGDYELTEEDKKAEESGEMMFSYGSSEIEIIEVQSVSWYKEGLHHNMMQLDGKLSPDELVDMASASIKM